jgi:hypothetical protein
MALPLPLPPSANLHAILLVTKSRSLGPRLVFHYPPLSPSAAALAAYDSQRPGAATTPSLDSRSEHSDQDSTDPDDDDHDHDADAASRTSAGRNSGRTQASQSHSHSHRFRPGASAWGRHDTIDEEHLDSNGAPADARGGDYDWDSVLGFRVDALEKMLTPTSDFNKRRFELAVESIVFVGAPMFVRDDGLWKKRRRNEKKADPDLALPLALTPAPPAPPATESPSPPESFVYPPGFEPGYGHASFSPTPSEAASDAASDTRTASTTAHDSNPDMTMFNVVFVLTPPPLEHHQRVKEMYDNVTRKYAKALKYEQARFHYVWKESKRIIDFKQRAKENGEPLTPTWRNIIASSPLAKSIAIMFDAISNDKIAHIHFDATFNTSFQIPQAVSTPYLPTALEPQMPGLWLTTSNVMLETDEAPMTQHAALLLLEDPEVLIKDLGGDSTANAVAIAGLIRRIVPTKSLLKISKKHGISAHDMEYIASHLVYWRRARLIDPLSQRDTYIVSPNADMNYLPAATTAFARQFPTLPALPKFLALLSGTPRIFKSFIPTYEHRDAYLEVLAWLMRGGWVTQLRTFAWVRVTPEIKAQVAVEMEREERVKKAEEARKELMSDNGSATESLMSEKRSSMLSTSTLRSSTPLRWTRRDRSIENMEDLESSIILSPRPSVTSSGSHYRGSPARAASDAGSNSSQRTTIALNSSGRPDSPSHLVVRDAKVLKPSPLHMKPTSPSLNSVLSPPSPLIETEAPRPQDFSASLVLSPQKASSLEARWLEKIGQTFEDTDMLHTGHPSYTGTNASPPKHDGGGGSGITGKDLREHWPMLLKHLDGKHAIEDLAPREGLKRKRVAVLFNAVKERGWLVVVRHW